MKRKVLTVLLFLYSCMNGYGQTPGSQPAANVTLNFVHVAGGKLLHTDSVYVNTFGEQYTVSKFRYYISQIVFTGKSPKVKPVTYDTCLLVDEMKPESKQVSLYVPAGSYDTISFLLGVDSIRNTSGAQSGALDPLMDMFWTWNTGYVMAKLEGTSPVSKLPRHMFEYHIGGFSGTHNVLKTINLPAPQKNVILTSGKQKKEIVIEVNVNSWFSGMHDLKIASQPACSSIGELAQKYADNYSQMFHIRSVNKE